MAKHTLKILRREHRKIFKVCLAIFQHYEIFRCHLYIQICNMPVLERVEFNVN